MKRTLYLSAFFLLAILSPASVAHPPARAEMPMFAGDSAKRLRTDLDRIFSDRRFAGARWGIEVFSLDRSEKLYERDPSGLFVPASNNKLVTAAVALMRLGADYRYETRILTDGQIENGVLKGNLIIVGSGDPCHAPQFQAGDVFAAFRNWAARLRAMNVHRIAGDIFGDEGAFDSTKFGLGWEWNDLGQGYAAPVGALQFNDNTLSLEISPGAEKGDPAFLKASPLPGYLSIENKIVTGAENTPVRVQIRRGSSRKTMVAGGSVPRGGAPVVRAVAVLSPAHYYLSALRQVLAEGGIDTSECEIKEKEGYAATSLMTLWSHSSPPLSEILQPLMKTSQNLYAETLTRTLGLALKGEGTFDKGKEVVEETLAGLGIEKESYVYADGSGLSRLNLISADALARILRHMYRQPLFSDFYDALPVAGIDGTLSARMKNTRAENNVHAKTGSIANVSAISGYVRTARGEMLAFSILANNFLVAREVVESVQDKALERLANFSGK
jgi:D-alanyl-D-alanine carboxypeptidase/D-alanyl-D-alanine-endopeptidase (penicillin-binding protein 4)